MPELKGQRYTSKIKLRIIKWEITQQHWSFILNILIESLALIAQTHTNQQIYNYITDKAIKMATANQTLQPISQSFSILEKLIQQPQISKQPPSTTQQSLLSILQLGIACIARQDLEKFTSIAKEFSQSLMETRHIFLHQQILIQSFQELRFIICKNNKLYTFAIPGKKDAKQAKQNKEQVKGYVLVGKVVSVYKRKKKDQEDFDHKEQREELFQLIEQGIIRLFEDGKYMLPKHEKHFEAQDILMHHDMPDSSIDEVYLGSQVYEPFVPIQKSIVLVIPSKVFKPECLSFIKSSLLHNYVDQANLLNRIMSKQQFYKNSILKGLFFIDEGQVQVKSGRIIARGWTTYGKCKTSGFGWKFKPVPFIRFLIKNVAIWKQFFNDITLNNQYPFNIIHILSLSDDEDFTSSAEWRSLGKRKIGGKSPKLPKLTVGARSVDESKFQQIQKLRHYDDKLNDIFSYKQDLLTRKLKGIVHGKFQPIFRDQRSDERLQKKKKILMLRLNSKASVLSKRQLPIDTQPTENILIMSVLKRLESIADMSETSTRRRQYSISQGMKQPTYYKNKRQNVKVLPMQIHERTKQLKRSKRY